MKIDGNQIKPGNVIQYEGKLWEALKTEHVKPGKGGAYMQVEMKAISVGTKKNVRFRSDEAVERVHFDEEEYQYLYAEGDNLIFMNQKNYEQVSLDKSVLGDEKMPFLQENMVVSLRFFEDEPMGISLPQQVTLTIEEADPVVKGQTASASFKPAVLENGLKIMVPPHVESGSRVVVDTGTAAYVERAKD